MLFWASFAAAIAVTAFALFVSEKKSGHGLASTMFIFVFIWFLAFPLRAYLLIIWDLPIQAPTRPDDSQILVALIFASFVAFATVLGFLAQPLFASKLPKIKITAYPPADPFWRVVLFLLFASSVSAAIAINYGFDGLTALRRLYSSSMKDRPGNGWYFFLAEIVSYSIVIYFSYILSYKEQKNIKILIFSFLVGVVSSTIVMILLNTRRPIAFIIFLVFIFAGIRLKLERILIPLAIVGVVFAAPILQVVRYSCITCMFTNTEIIAGKEDVPAEHIPDDLLGPHPAQNHPVYIALVTTSSSFEGVGHLAIWLDRTDMVQKLIGVDHGKSWMFNTALSLVPRQIWPDKPLIYGSIAEQQFLYPAMFETLEFASLPPSFIVDFAHGFGIPVALALAFLLGAGLRLIDKGLYDSGNMILRSLALFAFLNMFNVIRSGTGILQGLIVLSVICLFLFIPIRLPWETQTREQLSGG